MNIRGTVNLKRLLQVTVESAIIVLEGSTRSSKTISIIQFLISRCLARPGWVVRCFRKDGSTHKDTTILDFKMVMTMIGGQGFFKSAGDYNKTEKIYTFKNGATFSFHETKNIDELHGMACDDAWMNEVMEIAEPAWDQIGPRARCLKIMDFNPSFNHHWVFSKVLTREDVPVFHFHSTYKDNPFLTPGQIAEIEKYDPSNPINVRQGTADQWHWDVYGLGKRGKVEGAIFKLWEVTDLWPERYLCRRTGFGLDFGFHPDPAGLIECRIHNDGIYLRQWIYEHDLLITRNVTMPGEPSIQHRLEEIGVPKDDRIYADCAQPGSIKDLRLCGYNVIPCTKGPDSVMHGINLVNRYKLYVHRTSHDLQNELEHYSWAKNARGEWLQEPADKWNHLLDPLRYWAIAELQREVIPDRGHSRKGGRARH